MTTPDLLIVGGGLTGLACALRARELGLSPLVLEASDAVGGRVRTDLLEGFRLDRGFQVLLTAYPALGPYLDDLDLRCFSAGARVHWRDRLPGLFDPRRHPLKALVGSLSGPGGLGERRRLLFLARAAAKADPEALLEERGGTAAEALAAAGLEGELAQAFLRPWLAGIFLERPLATPAAWMRYVLHMFAHGRAAIPARGMGELPRVMAERLPPDAVRLGARVAAVEPDGVILEGGERLSARAVVVATDLPAAQRVLGEPMRAVCRSVTCLYFAATRDPLGGEPVLVLEGEGAGPVNNLCVPSTVAPDLAPDGAALISATVIGLRAQDDAALEASVREQLAGWFGPEVVGWHHLRTYRIPYALPVPAIATKRGPHRVAPRLWIAGDHRESASIQGALTSGRQAAEEVAAHLGSGAPLAQPRS